MFQLICFVEHQQHVRVKLYLIMDEQMMDIICQEMDVNFVDFTYSKTQKVFVCLLDETTWFGSNIKLNRRSILDSIQPKTIAEYEQQRAKQQEKYRQANEKWPFLSEYSEQFVIGKVAERRQPTEYV